MYGSSYQEVEIGVTPLTITPSNPVGGICASCPHNSGLCGFVSPSSLRKNASIRVSSKSFITPPAMVILCLNRLADQETHRQEKEGLTDLAAVTDLAIGKRWS